MKALLQFLTISILMQIPSIVFASSVLKHLCVDADSSAVAPAYFEITVDFSNSEHPFQYSVGNNRNGEKLLAEKGDLTGMETINNGKVLIAKAPYTVLVVEFADDESLPSKGRYTGPVAVDPKTGDKKAMSVVNYSFLCSTRVENK